MNPTEERIHHVLAACALTTNIYEKILRPRSKLKNVKSDLQKWTFDLK